MSIVQLLVMAKAPVPGQVKTRLCPVFSLDEAAALAAAALSDTMNAVEAVAGAGRVLALAGTLDGAVDAPAITARLHPRAIGHWRRIPQRGRDFAERLAHAHVDAARRGPVLQIGMDTPQVTGAGLESALRMLFRPGVDAVLGGALDGGWWALGLRDAAAARVLRSVPMSRPDTGTRTLDALQSAGLRVAALPRLIDVDTATEAFAVGEAAPGTAFAQQLRALRPLAVG